jgi:alcohol dehydrogenase (cytochrome c)
MMNRAHVLLSVILIMAAIPSRLDAQVPYDRIVAAAKEPGSWLTYSGNYAAHRFSPLSNLTAGNVAGLKPVWIYQVKEPGLIETTPLVADGVMFLTEPPSTVTALDLRSGRLLWSWSRPLSKTVRAIGFPKVNRGVALLAESVYVGTLDAHLVALDAKTGVVRWDSLVADNAQGYAITSAPLAIDGKIMIGVSGGEAGIRGFLDAYDSRTGDRLWRLYTIPGPGEPGHASWGKESWKTGGGPTWLTGSYDPALNLLYWGVGNPGPDWNGDVRPGDNLYTCSLLAIDPATGRRKWHFQFTPHDVHDWDANQIPMLFDGHVKGRHRKLVAVANRNAFYYLLDRETGEFLLGTPFAKQTWAKGLDEKGRPIVIPGTEPSVEGTLVYPSLQGATNWFSPSFSPRERLVYVAVREMGAYYFKGESDYVAGEPFMAGGEQALTGDKAYGAIRALEAETGKRKWEFRLHSPPWAGVLSTAGGLVFGGTNEGQVFALDAVMGELRWRFQTGGAVRSNPIAFSIDGAQRIAIASGYAIFVFGL